MRDCVREAKTRRLGRRVARIVAPVFRARDADRVRATCHLAADVFDSVLFAGWDCGGDPGPKRDRKDAACTALSREKSR